MHPTFHLRPVCVTAGKLCLSTPIFKGGSAGGFGVCNVLSSLFSAARFSGRKQKLSARGRSPVRGPGTPEATRHWHIHLVIALLPAPENCSLGGILNIHLIYSPLPPTAL